MSPDRFFHVSYTAISGRAVIHLAQCDKFQIVTVRLDIGVSSSLAAKSFLENPAVMGLMIDVNALCGGDTENDSG
jgi:Na+-transporting methylmalonyl-CoA/oxaloacetate decarboxylase beta subunit